MGDALDPNRLPPLRDVWATMRALSQEDYGFADDVLEPYQGDREKVLAFTRELIEAVSGILSSSADYGLIPTELMTHLVQNVPSEDRPRFQTAARLILAVHNKAPKQEQDIAFDSKEDYDGFVNAMLNTGIWLVRQIARKVGLTEEQVYDALVRNLAAR